MPCRNSTLAAAAVPWHPNGSGRALPPARRSVQDRRALHPVEAVHPDDGLVDLPRLRMRVVGVVDEPRALVAVAHDRLVPRPGRLAPARDERRLARLPAGAEHAPAPRVADRIKVAREVGGGVEEVDAPVLPPHRGRLDNARLPPLVVLD